MLVTLFLGIENNGRQFSSFLYIYTSSPNVSVLPVPGRHKDPVATSQAQKRKGWLWAAETSHAEKLMETQTGPQHLHSPTSQCFQSTSPVAGSGNARISRARAVPTCSGCPKSTTAWMAFTADWFPWCWRQEVQDQGVGQAGFILRILFLICRWPLLLCLHVTFSLCVSEF